MKTKSLFLAALVVVSAAVSAVGKDEPSSKAGLAVLPVKGSEVFKVIYKGETTGKVKLSLYNSQNEVVFTESLAGAEGFIRPLNFKGLAYGTYTLEVIDTNGKRTHKINHASSKPSVHVSKLANQDGKFLLSVSNPANSSVTIRIFDKEGTLLHNEVKKGVNADFAMVYKVTNSTGVSFEISDASGTLEVASF